MGWRSVAGVSSFYDEGRRPPGILTTATKGPPRRRMQAMTKHVTCWVACCLVLRAGPAAGAADSSARAFPASAAAYSGQFRKVGTPGGPAYFQFIGADCTVDLVATGTSLSVACQAASPAAAEAQVDGGAWTDITPATVNAPATAHGLCRPARCPPRRRPPLQAGEGGPLPHGRGRRLLHRPGQSAGGRQARRCPRYAVPPGCRGGRRVGRPGILDHVRCESGYGPAPIAGYDVLQPVPQKMGAGGGYVALPIGAQFRFHGQHPRVGRLDLPRWVQVCPGRRWRDATAWCSSPASSPGAG